MKKLIEPLRSGRFQMNECSQVEACNIPSAKARGLTSKSGGLHVPRIEK